MDNCHEIWLNLGYNFIENGDKQERSFSICLVFDRGSHHDHQLELDTLKIRRAGLLGISQGGGVALKFATTRSERITKLVLLAPGGVVPTRSSFILKAVMFSMLGRMGAQRINRLVCGKQSIHPEAVKFMDAIYTHFNVRIEKEYLFSDEELKCLSMPTLFFGGAQDVLFNIDAAAMRMQKLVPQLKVMIIPDMGHVLINLSGQITPFLTA